MTGTADPPNDLDLIRILLGQPILTEQEARILAEAERRAAAGGNSAANPPPTDRPSRRNWGQF